MSSNTPLRFLGISGSLRKASFNSGALRAIEGLLPEDVTFATADLRPIPFYDADVDAAGFPETVSRLRQAVADADALVFASPEYNYSVSGLLKNALEWMSRPPASPLAGKPCAVFGATVSPLGTARGQFHFRHICVSLNMIPVNAPHVDITSAKDKYDSNGNLTDAASRDQLRQLMAELKSLAMKLRSGA